MNPLTLSQRFSKVLSNGARGAATYKGNQVRLKTKSGIVAATMAVPFIMATAASADTTVTLPTCVDVKATPAVPGVPAVTHQETIIDTPAVPAVPPIDAIPAVTHVVHHDAITHIVHHDAVTHIVVVVDVPAIDIPAVPGVHIPAVPAVTHNEVVVDVAAYDETVIDTPAWDETVIDAPAYDETVIDSPAQPAVPGTDAVTHTEYGFRTRVQLFGSKEVKSVKGYQFVSGSTTKVNGVTIPGHWVAADSDTYYDIPDVVVNAVWGPSGVPSSVLGTGNVNLSVYGGPNHTVAYKAVKVTTSAGYTDWSDWSDWSTTNNHTNSDLVDTRTRVVTDKAAVPGKPAVPAVTHVVHHAAVSHVVHHPAVTHVVHHAAVTHIKVVIDTPEIPAVDIPGIPAVHIPALTHDTVVIDVAAFDETIIDTAAFDETIIDTPAVPAVPGVPAVPAVTHEVTVVDHAAIPGVPAVKGKECPTVLPHTGTSGQADWAIAAAAGLLIAGGSSALILTRRRRQAQ